MTATVEEPTQGLILYTDGGCRPSNPGYTGWGIHGYLYQDAIPKKGSGNSSHILTKIGYIPKSAKSKLTEIKPVCYIDAFGSSTTRASNNVAEIQACAAGFSKAKEYAVKRVQILTDSEYVCNGVKEWSPIWIKRNWVRIDGTPVPNSEEWKKLLEEYNELLSRGIQVDVNWVKGHNDNLGNERADKLATIGVMHSMNKEVRTEFSVTPAEGYWNTDVDKHPFFTHRWMYFNTNKDFIVPGEYYTGNQGKDDELLGKKISDGAYSVIQLKEPDQVVENLRNYQMSLAGVVNTIVLLRLDKLFTPEVYSHIRDYAGMATVRAAHYNLDLNYLDKDPLTKELRPPRLALRAIDALSNLKTLLENFRQSSKDLIVKDMTSIFYSKETVEKKGKVTTTIKFKPEFNVGFCALPYNVELDVDGVNKKIPITLTLGIDIADRNSLKRLESLEPKISLILWKEAEGAYRYATVIEAQGSYGIWAGIYSNMIFTDVGVIS